MRFGMVDRGGEPTLVLQTNQGFAPVSRGFRNVLDLVHADCVRQSFANTVAQEAVDFLDAATPWRIPLRPGKIVAVGRNYRAHAEELGNRPPEVPILFAKASSICTGPGAPIAVKPEYGRVDHEGELAVIIGRTMKDVPPESVEPCVAGYTLLNDVTARDLQAAAKAKGLPWFLAKNLDTFCPLGPAVIPADAVAWPPALDIEVRVNGEIRQQGNTGDMIFQLPELLAYISRHISLEPGDIIATGTPQGVSPLQPGDSVDVACPAIGVLSNPVV